MSKLNRLVSRRAVAVMAMFGLGLATACQPPLPPVLQPAPEILSATMVTPSPVTAGEELAVRLVVSHPIGVSTIRLSARPPSGAGPVELLGDDCWSSRMVEVESEPGVPVEIIASCTIPSLAQDGAWTLTAVVSPTGYYASAIVRLPFEVVGGTADSEPPAVSVSTVPTVVSPGSAVTVVVRGEDDHITSQVGWSFSFLQAPAGGARDTFRCDDVTTTRVSTTVVEWTFVCTTRTDQQPGRYAGEFNVWDLYDQRSIGLIEVTVATT